MRKGLQLILAAGVIVAWAQSPARAADQPAFKNEKEKASYAIGVYFGDYITNSVLRSSMEVDYQTVQTAIKDVLGGRPVKMNAQEARQAIMAYQQEARHKLAEKNKEAGAAFLAENKKKPGVKTHTVTLPDGKTAEMQYKVLKEGTGATPGSNDTVSVQYRGTLINGTEFDSSAKHGGQPAKFPVTHVIRGWTEALQMMKVGSKWEIYLPSDLAYGDNGSRGIEPGATLIFDVELVGIEAPHPTPAAQPLTSDIIKVPSAEELKKGAKIEVIKAEDAARMAKEAATNKAKASEK